METLYFNGDVITMEGEKDFAEAVLVADGRIKAVGAYDAVAAQKGADCRLRDLQGATLMPSFIEVTAILPWLVLSMPPEPSWRTRRILTIL